MELWTVLSVVAVAVSLAIALVVVWRRKRLPPPPAPIEAPEAVSTEKVEKAAPALSPVEEPAELALSRKLSKTRGLFGKLDQFFSRGAEKALEDKEWAELEETLLEADVGVSTTTQLLSRIKDRIKQHENTGRGIRDLIREETLSLFEKGGNVPFSLEGKERPYVISIVGVNGVGKTTTIGKLARHFKGRGYSVLLGAVDTFRAAAIQQLRIWSERAGVDFVTGREGADPGAVAFDAASAAKARGIDLVLLDTAGRLHNKVNLMDELKKIHRVIKKVLPNAPHETWLVIDGTLGQNSIQQAREFKKALDLTGVVVTKLDGTAKGGAMFAVTSELQLPVRFIGVGESAEDLIPFDAKNFIEAILA